jgi:membrane associated rhomboid family serine protease
VTALTSMFLHASFLHIFGNMIFLAIFGPTVEDAMGRVRFLVFYLLGGLIALGAQVAAGPGLTGPTLGASGAIAAVLGGYILLYPRARVLALVFIVFFFTLVEVPAVFLLAFWFVEQLYFGLAGLASVGGTGSSSEGVAYFAHIGGFAFGLLAIKLFVARRARGPAAPPSLPVYQPHDAAHETTPRMTRLVVFGALLFFIAGLAFLTVAAIIDDGVNVLTVVSALVVALLSIGIIGAIVGALRNPPRL